MNQYLNHPRVRSVLATSVAAVSALMICVPGAGAITNGSPDGDAHPSVGVLLRDRDGVLVRLCSGTLVAPKLFLTAGHCTFQLEEHGVPADQAYVSFDSRYVPGTSTVYRGTYVTDPDFRDYNGRGMLGTDVHDLAVIHFQDAPQVSPAVLPPAGFLDMTDLRGQRFTTVGYGMLRAGVSGGFIDPSADNNRPLSDRYVATGTFRNLHRDWLTLNMNAATGNGGTCYGDSGGPHFLGDTDLLVSLTATGDYPCVSTDVTYRLDTPWVRDFLAAEGMPL